ncbi:lasso peptide biosynthesis B2 protein [Longimicrobium sp.]|uniref:lasso peptide biosynthesis B2 protein n=1 Tax=Longimicrobium sp. TaxID=2029185 RepID=UPI002E31AE29|nr:lasso peptide biosynthesis B2 protein [Longimicrobium sp.]HEX6041226.1 lasso peptide biosynthesis B2 protein [Longimicrobium sp.]
MTSRGRRDVPGVMRCMLALLVTRLHLKAFGFGRSVARARRMGGRGPAFTAAADGVAERTAHRVAVAGAFFPGRAVCLEQSLALYVLLRRRGVRAELRLGVVPSPFHAHAWVEVDGVPVNEDAETVARFLPMPAMPA